MRNEPSASLRSGGIAPLQRRAVVSRRVSRPTRAAASGPNNTPNTWSSSPNLRSSQYSPTGGNLGNTRDLYEGATGLDVLAMQKDLVAEGFLGRQHATGYAPFSSIFPIKPGAWRTRVPSSPRRVSRVPRILLQEQAARFKPPVAVFIFFLKRKRWTDASPLCDPHTQRVHHRHARCRGEAAAAVRPAHDRHLGRS
jgi:hypothetical protein